MRIVAIASLLFAVVGVANAQDQADPSGTWEWTVNFGGNTMNRVLVFDLEDGTLTGNVSGRNDTVTEISDALYEDGKVSFRVVRSFNDQEFVIHYQGTVEGDEIRGETRGTFNGEERSWEWVATRKVE